LRIAERGNGSLRSPEKRKKGSMTGKEFPPWREKRKWGDGKMGRREKKKKIFL